MFRILTLVVLVNLLVILNSDMAGAQFPMSLFTFLPSFSFPPSFPFPPSFSFPSFSFSLPFFGSDGGGGKVSKKPPARPPARSSFQECPPAAPPVSTLFEQDFLQCSVEVDAIRGEGNRHPDQNKKADETIVAYGYDLITYDNVTTDDGYILTIFRITGGAKSPTARDKPAVLLHHGLLSASDCWLLQPQDRNLAFKLADAGYDVWLANARGTSYSQRHMAFTTADETYWDFGIHEIGMYDVPATIRLMLRETGQSAISYVGHSMGGAVISIALSEIPDLNSKVKAVIMLAPAIFVGHSYNPIRSFTAIIGTPLQNWVYHALEGHFDGDHHLEGLNLSPIKFCSPTALRCGVCDNLLFFLFGYDASQANYTNLPNILSKIKNTVSLKTVVHFGQNMLSCHFRQYSYGFLGNYDRYGWFTPPAYNLKAITSPVYIFYGENDNFVPPIEIELIQDAMLKETIKEVHEVAWPAFNHIDFVMANDADILVYDRVLYILDTHAVS